ncbi:Bestrophin, RFP-TM, chloride channel-domain-containing protein [Xylariomycetidae sp. FL2044]|nr:Bestrophin, RFP-TM, chloride channel-domain-containing protein [Xylariomycetidae sp. FL2044]
MDSVYDQKRTSTSEETLLSRRSTPHFAPESFIFLSGSKGRSLDNTKFDDYFLGPRELDRHSKWPMMLRIHGSCIPELIVPILFVGAWTTTVCLFSRHVKDLGIKHTLLVVLGFIVALSLSFRSSTAYERYMEGRKAWTTLTMVSQNLARNIWINAEEREDHAKDDLIAKMTALNLIVAYARALKHRLRFEPYTHYTDLKDLVEHLDTFAKEATELEAVKDDIRPKSPWKSWGEYLGMSFTLSNPRKVIKRAEHPLGNLPLEILNHLTVYIHDIVSAGCFKANIYQTQALNAVMTLNDIQATTDRILNTPLPLAYSIAISQLTWTYILILPFQLYETLGLVAIPGTMFAAYMILGFAYIGQEIENPFGHDVNDLPLDDFCNQLAADIDIIASTAPRESQSFVKSSRNRIMHPLNHDGYETWSEMSVEDIRSALRRKALISMNVVKPRLRKRRGREEDEEGNRMGKKGYEKVTITGTEAV